MAPEPDSSPTGGEAALRVLGFTGSLRSGSFNRALLRAAADVAPEGVRIDIFDLHDIPLYDRDVEEQGDPEPVRAFKRAIGDADAILIATPEYQHSIPGVLKNALDWASRPPGKSTLKRKPAAIMGATPGRFGTARAQQDLRKVLVYNDVQVLTQPPVMVRRAGQKFDDDLVLVDDTTRDRIRGLLVHLAAWARFVSGWSPPET